MIDTINKAKASRNIDQPLIIHSDRGSPYVAKEYKKATENMQRSYSKKAFPWDNACIESFHSIIKREWLNRFKIRDFRISGSFLQHETNSEYSCAMKSHFRKIGNQMSGSGNHLCEFTRVMFYLDRIPLASICHVQHQCL